MTLQEFTGIIENSDEVRIIKDGKDIFTGWLEMLTMQKPEIEKTGGGQ